eukprot:gene3147-3616_t
MAIKDCQSSVKGARQNIVALKKGMRDVLSIVEDLECISKEAKSTTDVCTTRVQSKLHESIYAKLTEKEKVLLCNVSFYEDIVSVVKSFKHVTEAMTDGKVVKLEYYWQFLAAVKDVIVKKIEENVLNENDLELFQAISDWLDSTMANARSTTPSVVGTNTSENTSIAEKSACSSEMIEMKALDKRSGCSMQRDSRGQRGAKRGLLVKIRGIRKGTDEFDSSFTRRVFCKKHKIYEIITSKIEEHIVQTGKEGNTAIPRIKVQASTLWRIISTSEETDKYTDVDHRATRYMRKVRLLLKRVQRLEDMGALDVKSRLRIDADVQQCAEKVDEAAGKMREIKSNAITQINMLKEALLEERAADEAIQVAKETIERRAKEAVRGDVTIISDVVMDVLKEIGSGKELFLTSLIDKNKDELLEVVGNGVLRGNLADGVLKLLTNERESLNLAFDLAIKAIRSVENYNKTLASKKGSQKAMILERQLNQIVDIVIEKSIMKRESVFTSEGKLNSFDYKELSKKVFMNALESTIVPVINPIASEKNFDCLERALSLPNFRQSVSIDDSTAVKGKAGKMAIQFIADVVSEEFICKRNNPLGVILEKNCDVKLLMNAIELLVKSFTAAR